MLPLTSQERIFSDSIAVYSSKESTKREEKPGPNHGGHIDIGLFRTLHSNVLRVRDTDRVSLIPRLYNTAVLKVWERD